MLKKSPSWEMGKDYTQQFVVSLRGFKSLIDLWVCGFSA
ncbi:hypothetical protein CSC37_0448 [Escherichia coli]|nr:hypothetical protein CSC37_0448 [Escherichia coli]